MAAREEIKRGLDGVGCEKWRIRLWVRFSVKSENVLIKSQQNILSETVKAQHCYRDEGEGAEGAEGKRELSQGLNSVSPHW